MKMIRSLAPRTLAALLLLILPVIVQAQFTFTTNNGALTITGYTGPGGHVIIPETTNGLPVTAIADYAFSGNLAVTRVTIPDNVTSLGTGVFAQCWSLTSVMIPDSVTSIGDSTFSGCSSLTSTAIPDGVTSIGDSTFSECSSLTNVTIPDSVTGIGAGAFYLCTSLTRATIPDSVTNIGTWAFYGCTNLTGIYFHGNAPNLGSSVFYNDNHATVYYLAGTTGWGATFGECPTTLWLPQILTGDASFGLQTNQFGFNISWASGMVVAVDACTNLADPVWTPLKTNTLTSDTLYFSDPQWTNYPARFYRVRYPQVQPSAGNVGVRTNQFGFTITGTSGMVVAVETCTNLANPVWSPLQTNTLIGNTLYFSDPRWTNYPARFYRVRQP